MVVGSSDPASMAMLIGLAFVVGSFAVIIIIVLVTVRSRRAKAEMLHRERMLALEKGVPIPPDYLESPRRKRPYVAGLIWAGIGLGAVVWGIVEGESDANAWGLIPFFVGIALLIGDWLSSRREQRAGSGSGLYPVPGEAPRAPDSHS
jgi:hypothetical protein